MGYFSSSPDYQAYLISLLLRETTKQDTRSPFRFIPKVPFIGRGQMMDNYLRIFYTLQFLQTQGILSDLIIRVCATDEKEDHIEPVLLGSVRMERQKNNSSQLVVPVMTEWEEKLSDILIHKDMEFVEVLGSIDRERANDFLKVLGENWYNGKFREGYPPEKMRETLSGICRSLWYDSKISEKKVDLTKIDVGLHIFLGFLFLERKGAVKIEYPRIPQAFDGDTPHTIIFHILREFWNEEDFVIINKRREEMKHCFEFDFDRDQLKHNGIYMRFGKKNLDFIRTFFDLLEEGQEHIGADEILLGVERGFADIAGEERHKAKKTYIYYPRKTVNKSIESDTELNEFFGLDKENIYLQYPQYVKLSKKS